MIAKTTPDKRKVTAFPKAEVESRLHRELKRAVEERAILTGDWDPVLDSLRMVSVVLTLEDLFSFQLKPERLVQPGGYDSIDQGVSDMTARLQGLWEKKYHTTEVA